jgi:peptidoglycan/LPS O-acetylase OafA/YrhL
MMTGAQPAAANLPKARVVPFPGTQRVYRPQLDVLRFFAFLCVYLHHTMSTGSSGGLAHRFPAIAGWYPLLQQTFGLGLCLFFFLSSYLITSLLGIERARTGTVDLRKFYLRRILRIWPLYLAFLAGISLLGLWWPDVRIQPMRLLALLLLAGNWYAIYAGLGPLVVAHLWSISVEEQFYLLWPRAVRRLSSNAMGALCVLICAVALAATWILYARGNTALDVWFNSLPQSLFFAGGALFARIAELRQRRASLAVASLFIAAGFSLWLLAERVGGLTDHVAPPHTPGAATLGYALAAAGCAVLLWGFLHLPEYTLVAPLLYLGRISYGLYIFHAIFVVGSRTLWANYFHVPGATLLTGLLLTFLAAAASYQFLEKPFLKYKNRLELIQTGAS